MAVTYEEAEPLIKMVLRLGLAVGAIWFFWRRKPTRR